MRDFFMVKDIKRIEKFLEGIQWLFQIQNFDRKLTIMKNDDTDKQAEVTFNEDYQRLKIRLFPIFFEQTLAEQRKCILHELCHTLTLPTKRAFIEFMSGTEAITQETVRALNERQTSQIENILDGLLQGNMRYARKAYSDFIKVKTVKKKKRKK